MGQGRAEVGLPLITSVREVTRDVTLGPGQWDFIYLHSTNETALSTTALAHASACELIPMYTVRLARLQRRSSLAMATLQWLILFCNVATAHKSQFPGQTMCSAR